MITAILYCQSASATPTVRRREPVTVGLPLPRGWCSDAGALAIVAADGVVVPVQSRVTERWSDGSIRWVLLDFQVSGATGGNTRYRLGREGNAPKADGLTVEQSANTVLVTAGEARFCVATDGALEASASAGSATSITCAFTLADGAGQPVRITAGELSLEESGPLRTTVLVTSSTQIDQRPLRVAVRYHFFAGLPAVRVQATLHNPSRAVHAGGFWELGDPGSLYLKEWSFVGTFHEGIERVTCSCESDSPAEPRALPFMLYQDSSGGENWDARTHVNREGRVPVRFRGYQVGAGDDRLNGLRATPVVGASARDSYLSVSHRYFWERFPKAVTVTGQTLRLGLLPCEFSDLHELQGGEQITEEFVVSFAEDDISDQPLQWVRDPLCLRADPEWYSAAEAVPYLTPAANDPNVDYLRLVNGALDARDGFVAKRERIDEYGWRNFGDLYADHEIVKHQGPDLFVSHYNNQYDAVAGFATHFFRSGDWRWWTLCQDLARHVIDIDIYHTDEDKVAYNHGLFWHTNHHVNAGLSTHRTYPRSDTASGGPSAEHNYSTGLLLYHLVTGDTRARDAVVELAEWVIAMDDGRRTPLRWLSHAPTGLASQTGSPDYHGPGRAPGNGIVSLLNAFRLTGERKFLRKVDELIRRCVHPQQDLDALHLLDAERRWYYTVFLQALGRYLDVKTELGELDERYAYAQAALLHYARWMAVHEYPYLDKPEILQYPNETWAAQDMRKSEVFKIAAKYAPGEERALFLTGARRFFDYSTRTLRGMPSHCFTRPTVLMLTNGYAQAWFDNQPNASSPKLGRAIEIGRPRQFVPQKLVARRRVAALAAGAAAGLTAVGYLLFD